MTDFNYAHKDTGAGERKSRTAQFNSLRCSALVKKLRKIAFENEIPTASDETLQFLCTLARAKNAENILEIGTAVGISGIALLEACSDASLTTIERDETFFASAEENFGLADCEGRVIQILGDAAVEILSLPDESFDFIFMDCAKVQYVKMLPRLKELLKRGGVLVADDVLLFGWVTGEEEPPKKRKMLVRHIREYIEAVASDSELSTSILDIGDGIALSVKL